MDLVQLLRAVAEAEVPFAFMKTQQQSNTCIQIDNFNISLKQKF
jgi:hypothetical protein